MAFKKAPPPSLAPDSPEKLFLELPRRRFVIKGKNISVVGDDTEDDIIPF